MKKLSEYRDEEALDLLADLLEPVSEIIGDMEVVKKFRKNKFAGISLAIKQHKTAVMTCLALLNGESVETYHCNILDLPRTIMDVINDDDLKAFFSLQSQEMDKELFGSATTTGKVEE